MVSSAVNLEQHVRHLRRYASMLTGSKETGDALILACLEEVAETGDHLRPGFGLVELFRRFQDLTGRVGYAVDLSQWRRLDRAETQTLMRLASLDAVDRGILLMRKVEGLSEEEIGFVFALSQGEIRLRLINASKTMMGLESHRILIIEDEYLIASDLGRIVEEMGHSVCGVAGTADAAVSMAAATEPSLLLADLRLEDGHFSGKDAAEAICSTADIPVVFVTAYPDQAATSDRTVAGGSAKPLVVPKPFHPVAVANAVNLALARHLTAAFVGPATP